MKKIVVILMALVAMAVLMTASAKTAKADHRRYASRYCCPGPGARLNLLGLVDIQVSTWGNPMPYYYGYGEPSYYGRTYGFSGDIYGGGYGAGVGLYGRGYRYGQRWTPNGDGTYTVTHGPIR